MTLPNMRRSGHRILPSLWRRIWGKSDKLTFPPVISGGIEKMGYFSVLARNPLSPEDVI